MSEPLKINDAMEIGSNQHGYTFYVGRLGERWVGYAQSDGAIFFLPQIRSGFEIGHVDKEHVILLTGAIAQDAAHGYGGIDKWAVPEAWRGRSEDLLRYREEDEEGEEE